MIHQSQLIDQERMSSNGEFSLIDVSVMMLLVGHQPVTVLLQLSPEVLMW